MRRTISIVDLRAHGACADQLALFRATFGDGPVAVTEANMSRAVEVGLWIEWLAHFIPAPALAAFEAADEQAGAAYNEAYAQAWAAFQAARAPAWAAYEAARAPAWAAYEAARDQAWAVYEAACAPARAAFEAAYDQAGASYRRALVGPLVRALRAEGAA
jgi:hypothetical protein